MQDMNKSHFIKLRRITSLVCSSMAVTLLASANVWAAPACPSPPCGNPPSCDNALVITPGASLSFGWIAAQGAGTVSVSTAGVRSNVGSALPMTGGTHNAGSFTVDTGGLYCQTYPLVSIAVTSPATLTHSTLPANTMTVDNFSTDPVAGILYSPGATILVGGRLNVGFPQQQGTYSGTVQLTVTFQ